MITRIDLGLLVAVSHDQLRLRSDKLPTVFEEYPVYAPRLAAVARRRVPPPFERVEGIRVFGIPITDVETGVHETIFRKVAVREGPGGAVKISRDYNREVVLLTFLDLCYLR